MIYRVSLYVAGLAVLAFGISLNTRTDLGVSPIISVSYSISVFADMNFGNVTLGLYAFFVLIEMIIHMFMKRWRSIPPDLLQIVLSIAFTRLLNLFEYLLPNFVTDLADTVWGSMPSRLFFLVIAVIGTGIGAALSLNMRLIPNPGDGIVQAISDVTKKDVGFIKNCVDICCVCATCALSLLFSGRITGIGIGTLMAMIGVGRVIAVFNHLTLQKTLVLAGIEDSGAAE